MHNLHEGLARLSDSHRAALTWFIEHRGQEVPWPSPMPDGTFLVTRPKGILKPKGWRHALSVRQMLVGPYADAEPELQVDGSWHYQYFQEGPDPNRRDDYYTNKALIACIEDQVPIGVLRQSASKPQVRYKVMGLAWVREWRKDGYFVLQGLSPTEESLARTSGPEPTVAFNTPVSMEDARRRIMSAIVQRQGQPQFRAKLFNAYQGRCAITGCDAASALEAAHIMPYRGPATNYESNGLLLRCDIHTLFDLGLISIDSITMTVLLCPALASGHYSGLNGLKLFLPPFPAHRPSADALAVHRKAANL